MSEIISIAREMANYPGREILINDVPEEIIFQGRKEVARQKTIQTLNGPTDSGEYYAIDLVGAKIIEESNGDCVYNLTFQVEIDRKEGDGYKPLGDPFVVSVHKKK